MTKPASRDIRHQTDETLDIAQAAAYCHIGYEAMRELIDSGEVPAASFNQKHVVVHIDDLRDYVRKRAREQAEERRRRRESLTLVPEAVPTSHARAAAAGLEPL